MPTVPTSVLHLTFHCILILRSTWLETSHRLDHLFLLQSRLPSAFELHCPLLHVIIEEARWNSFLELDRLFVSLVGFIIRVLASIPQFIH